MKCRILHSGSTRDVRGTPSVVDTQWGHSLRCEEVHVTQVNREDFIYSTDNTVSRTTGSHPSDFSGLRSSTHHIRHRRTVIRDPSQDRSDTNKLSVQTVQTVKGRKCNSAREVDSGRTNEINFRSLVSGVGVSQG